MLKVAKAEAVSKLIMECDRGIKKLYQVIYNLTGKYSINPLQDSDRDKELADKFADLFINKIKEMRDQLNKYSEFDLRLNAKPKPIMLK